MFKRILAGLVAVGGLFCLTACDVELPFGLGGEKEHEPEYTAQEEMQASYDSAMTELKTMYAIEETEDDYLFNELGTEEILKHIPCDSMTYTYLDNLDSVSSGIESGADKLFESLPEEYVHFTTVSNEYGAICFWYYEDMSKIVFSAVGSDEIAPNENAQTMWSQILTLNNEMSEVMQNGAQQSISEDYSVVYILLNDKDLNRAMAISCNGDLEYNLIKGIEPYEVEPEEDEDDELTIQKDESDKESSKETAKVEETEEVEITEEVKETEETKESEEPKEEETEKVETSEDKNEEDKDKEDEEETEKNVDETETIIIHADD